MPPFEDDAEVLGVPGEEHGHLAHVLHSAVAGHGAVIHVTVVHGCVVGRVVHLTEECKAAFVVEGMGQYIYIYMLLLTLCKSVYSLKHAHFVR
jgi:hypothetical protein